MNGLVKKAGSVIWRGLWQSAIVIVALMLLVALLAGGYVGFLWLEPWHVFTVRAPGFTRSGWSSIHSGMTRQEVLDILGEPSSGSFFYRNPCALSSREPLGYPPSDLWEYWNYSEPAKTNSFSFFIMYRICFNENGNVENKLAEVSEESTSYWRRYEKFTKEGRKDDLSVETIPESWKARTAAASEDARRLVVRTMQCSDSELQEVFSVGAFSSSYRIFLLHGDWSRNGFESIQPDDPYLADGLKFVSEHSDIPYFGERPEEAYRKTKGENNEIFWLEVARFGEEWIVFYNRQPVVSSKPRDASL